MAAESKGAVNGDKTAETVAAEGKYAVNGNKTAETLYTKEQLKNSQKFANRRDLLEVLLEDGKRYPMAKAEQMVAKFMKGDMG